MAIFNILPESSKASIGACLLMLAPLTYAGLKELTGNRSKTSLLPLGISMAQASIGLYCLAGEFYTASELHSKVIDLQPTEFVAAEEDM